MKQFIITEQLLYNTLKYQSLFDISFYMLQNGSKWLSVLTGQMIAAACA